MNIQPDFILKNRKQIWKYHLQQKFSVVLTLKAPITTAADNKFWVIYPNFQQK